MSVAWESRRGGSTVARHEWKGLSKMSGKLEDLLEKQREDRRERASRRTVRRGQVPGAFEPEESDEE
jgi:DDB1- and CUL4-associated factor 11